MKKYLVFVAILVLFSAGMAKAVPPTAPFGGTVNGPLNVVTGDAGTVTADSGSDDLVIENSGHGGMTILTPDAFDSTIDFGSPTDPIGARIIWDYTQQLFTIGATSTVGAGVRILVGNGSETIRFGGGGQVNLTKGTLSEKYTVTTDNTDGVDTYLAAQMFGKLIRRGTGDEITGAVVDVTDTAANIVATLPNCQVGNGYIFRVNNEDSTHTIQVDGGVGVTMSPNDPSTAIPANSTGTFQVVATNCTAASEAVTIHALGFATH